VADKLKVFVVKKVGDILLPASKEVIQSHDLIAFVQKPFAKMRADKARTACD
jgi:hypothetical protein